MKLLLVILHFFCIYCKGYIVSNQKKQSGLNQKIHKTSLHDNNAISSLCSEFGNVESPVKLITMGGIAGGVRSLSRAFVYPFDTFKTREQAGIKDPKLIQQNLFKGVFLTVLAAIPANSIFFLCDAILLNLLSCIYSVNSPNISMKLLSTSIASLPLAAIKIPAERIKQVTQINSLSVTDTIKSIASNGLSSFYIGGDATLLRELPYNVIQQTAFYFMNEYKVLKSVSSMTDVNIDDNTPLSVFIHSIPVSSKGLEAACYGLFAAMLAALLTQPADMIKTRMMVGSVGRVGNTDTNIDIDAGNDNDNDSSNVNGSGSREGKNKSSIVNTAYEIIEEEGVLGLFKGLNSRLLLVSAGGALYFFTAETVSEIIDIKL